jgi:hypothetical protein
VKFLVLASGNEFDPEKLTVIRRVTLGAKSLRESPHVRGSKHERWFYLQFKPCFVIRIGNKWGQWSK